MMLLETQTLNEYLDDPAWQIIGVTSRQTTGDTHLPGAFWIDPSCLFGRTLYPDPTLICEHLNGLGFSFDKPTAVYDNGSGLFAGRLFWTLSWLGHRQLAYLNGGIIKWMRSGYPLVSKAKTLTPTKHKCVIDSRLMVDQPACIACLDQPDIQFWDTRSKEEYRGTIRKSLKAGHIPGALHYEWSSALVSDMTVLRPLKDIEADLKRAGIDKNKTTIVYCQAHVRSAFSFMLGKILGFKDIRAYVGGWQEWGNQPDSAVQSIS